MTPGDTERLRGCPQCGSDAFRNVTPLAEYDVYTCENCPHRWSE
jgi:predicted  nucleic acid-binding Zn-ribbon protein